ncbi:MAG: FeoC-like transcriptional regulator [Chromatiaceae bacterium]|nr:FeoC-like transcriptional regulator [Chromatiaceae bacterium]MCF7996159.1 FeoC-like transcriptional regulator [Chromatiaceae bacterium]MCF8016224.1 FeoC-like transcriptional regulator [Chromatiaceae bacterium]
MLTTARDLVREQGVISLQEVAFKLGVPSQVARAMLQKWVAKGLIEPLPTTAACAGCTLCDSAPRELYRWCESADLTICPDFRTG